MNFGGAVIINVTTNDFSEEYLVSMASCENQIVLLKCRELYDILESFCGMSSSCQMLTPVSVAQCLTCLAIVPEVTG